MKELIIISLLSLYLILSCYFYREKKQELINTKYELIECKKIINHQLENIKEKNLVIKSFYNYTTRVQLMIGVDTIDNVFTFRERLKNPIRMNEIKKCVNR